MPSRPMGYRPDPEHTDFILGDPDTPKVYALSPSDANRIRQSHTNRDPVLLTNALLALQPNFKRGAQRRGTCVGWGWEVCGRIAHAVDIWIEKNPAKFVGEFSIESCYGGGRCEARGKTFAGFQDGSYGSATARWVTKWGWLPRKNWGLVTGNPDHDVTTHSEDRAVQYGAYGNGGKGDNSVLDDVCKKYPANDCVLITGFDDAANAIINGWPIAVCSMQGFTMKRDSEGFCAPRGQWAHCMAFVGVRFGSRPGLLCMNSWGFSNNGPHGIETNEEVMKCSFWVDAEVCTRMLRQQDSFAVTGVKGLEPRTIDWSHGWSISGRS